MHEPGSLRFPSLRCIQPAWAERRRHESALAVKGRSCIAIPRAFLAAPRERSHGTILRTRSAVIDFHLDFLAVLEVGHFGFGPHRQTRMGGSHPILVESLAIGGFPALKSRSITTTPRRPPCAPFWRRDPVFLPAFFCLDCPSVPNCTQQSPQHRSRRLSGYRKAIYERGIAVSSCDRREKMHQISRRRRTPAYRSVVSCPRVGDQSLLAEKGTVRYRTILRWLTLLVLPSDGATAPELARYEPIIR